MFAAVAMGAMAQSQADSTTVANEEKADKVHGTGQKGEKLLEPEEMPQFPGGQKGLLEYLSKNVTYPALAEKYGVEGRVIMSFVVEKDGSTSGISANKCEIKQFNTTKFSQETESRQKELKEQFALLLAKEGARVIRTMPKWTPGKKDGNPVRVKYTVPLTFRMR